MGQVTVTLFAILVASIFYMTAASIACSDRATCNNEWAYAVAVGVVSVFFSGILSIASAMTSLPEMAHSCASSFLFIWWAAGTGVGTFRAPFTNPGVSANGYFSAWFALLASAYYCFISISVVRNAASAEHGQITSTLGVMLISNVFFVTSAATLCDQTNCSSYNGYAVALGVIGLVICLCLFAMKFAAKDALFSIGKILAGFNALWWTIGTGIVTFKAPFTFLGNGYFAAWFSLFASVYLLALLTPEIATKLGVNNSVTDENNNNDKPEPKEEETQA